MSSVSGAQATDGAAPFERRSLPRVRTLQRAEIVMGQTLQTARLLDLHERGARLDLGIPLALPARFMLRLPDGRQVAVERRWAVGTRLGVAFVPQMAADSASLDRATQLLAMLETLQSDRVFGALRTAHFFGDAGVSDAARAAEAALDRLRSTMHHLVHGTPAAGPDHRR